VFLRRSPTGRSVQALEVIELEPLRRAVTRSLDTAYPIYGTLTIESLGPDSCRLTQEHRVTLPTGTPVATVRHARDLYTRTVRNLTNRLAVLAPHLAEKGEWPTAIQAALGAYTESDPELVTERRRPHVAGAVLPIIATVLVVAAIAAASPSEAGGIIAAATVCSGAVLAGVMRLLSSVPASIGQWRRRYFAGVALLVPAAVILAGRFTSGGNADDCGRLFDRMSPPFPVANFHRECATAAHNRLLDVIVWASVGSVTAVAYGLRLRRQRHRSQAGSSTSRQA
jgi:hypothetical protein